MAQQKQKQNPRPFLLVEEGRPLVAIPIEIDGRRMVCYVPEDEPVDDHELPQSVRDALNLAGAWSDLDWEEAQATLERIRRDGKPAALRETTEQ